MQKISEKRITTTIIIWQMDFRHMDHRVKDISLAELGKKKIDWAEAHMPVLIS